MAKQSEHLTQRQRQSQRIMREKSARKKRRALIRKAQIACGVLAVGLVAGGGFWAWKTSFVSNTLAAIHNGMYQMTARSGFALESFYLEGRNRTPMQEITKALGLKKGDPILQLSLQEMRERLEKIGSVRYAAVERELPDRLIVRIVEREPVAIWQNQGKMALIDDNGVVMNDISVAGYPSLPLVVGGQAPEHVGEVLALLASDKQMANRFEAAVRISGRRWNIRLKDGKEIKLPENNPEKAWRALADIQQAQQLLDRDVKVIDLRVGGRLFIKVAPEENPGATPGAKET